MQGGVAETTELLAQRFDHILYTGNGNVARIVMRAAAEHLTPVTLELGGKSPAIVSRNADIDVAARRIAWGKFVNAGQTCIAPDYVLVERPVHDQLVAAIGTAITAFYGDDPQASADYAPDRQRRPTSTGWRSCSTAAPSPSAAQPTPTPATSRRPCSPAITTDDPVMAEEIFGPILPVIAVDSLDEAIALVNARRQAAGAVHVQRERRRERQGDRICNEWRRVRQRHAAARRQPEPAVRRRRARAGWARTTASSGSTRSATTAACTPARTKLDPALMYPPYTESKAKLIRRGFTLPDPRDVFAAATGSVRRAVRRD